MRRLFGIAATLAALSGFAIASCQGGSAPMPAFKSAELVSASDVPIPFNSVANGIVLLNATIGETGKVEDVVVLRALASVTELASHAVRSWGFAPGLLNGKPATTRLSVAVVFCPTGPSVGQLSLPAADSESREEVPKAYPSRPVEIVAGAFPLNPTIIGGTVIVQVMVNPDGGLDYAKVVKNVPGLTAPSLQTVNEKWKFKPAILYGKPVRSTFVIVFAFRPPANNSY